MEIAVDRVEAGSARLIGRLDFSGGTLHYEAAAEDGNGLYIGLYPDEKLPGGSITWERYVEGGILPFTGDGKNIKISEGVSDLSGTYYVYIGSSGTDLLHVAGTVRYMSAEQSR